MDGYVLTLRGAPISWRGDIDQASTGLFRSQEKQPELKMPSDKQKAFLEGDNGPESHQEIFRQGNLVKDTISCKSTKKEKKLLIFGL